MTIRVVYSRHAAAGVEEIFSFLLERSARAAQRFREPLSRGARQLSLFPNSGPPGLTPGTRRLIVGDYIVSYRRQGEDVEIFAVRHARRRDARF
ncbi:MAG TPA: type II toxin-antitoxin system RelE/ParE family toxin [Stellaceae bacterium]|nr:type II toxin-antitoxin system RelE/ParE family toxin [Stellaceae bacterium]